MSSYKDFLNSNDHNSGSDSDESDEDYVPAGAKLSAESSCDDSSDEEIPEDDFKKQKPKKDNVEKEVTKDDDVPPIDKKRANEIWSDFLADVNVQPKKSTVESSNVPKPDDKATKEEQLPKPSNDLGNTQKIDVVEFAGETFSLSSSSALVKMPGASEDPKPLLNGNSGVTNGKTPVSSPSVSAPLKRGGGLQSLLGNISQKKKKLSTLEKTLYDWKTFKKEEGIEEELQNHNKGKEGYIEKQRFLERSDWRSYEVERSLKFNKRKP